LRDQLKKDGMGAEKPFPSKSFTKMSAKQIDERRAKLEEFVQHLVASCGCRYHIY
jgi:hypothetical protein